MADVDFSEIEARNYSVADSRSICKGSDLPSFCRSTCPQYSLSVPLGLGELHLGYVRFGTLGEAG